MNEKADAKRSRMNSGRTLETLPRQEPECRCSLIGYSPYITLAELFARPIRSPPLLFSDLDQKPRSLSRAFWRLEADRPRHSIQFINDHHHDHLIIDRKRRQIEIAERHA
ncbi:hypothetical protein TNCV_809931 [Trichonephila clavipes]|uniref:Uncharacterized protein n=1 Tax=Trichonephila clavipes TaxID=2585209 RepID=A0A8X6SBZ0_TRICX|nr:hypothetical protein TNCV_809931 [Trichonephila clavipes]